jgi:hypothetical protein
VLVFKSFEQENLKTAEELENEDREAQQAVCCINILFFFNLTLNLETSRAHSKRNASRSCCGAGIDEKFGWSCP